MSDFLRDELIVDLNLRFMAGCSDFLISDFFRDEVNADLLAMNILGNAGTDHGLFP